MRHSCRFDLRAGHFAKTVLFDVDDLIFDYRYAHLIMETLNQTGRR